MRAAAKTLAHAFTSSRWVAKRSQRVHNIVRATSSTTAPSPLLRRNPRERPADGPTYSFDLDSARVAQLRFLAFHGCGTRYTVLYRECDKADEQPKGGVGRRGRNRAAKEVSDDVGFDAGELESTGEGDGPGWRVRLANSQEITLNALKEMTPRDMALAALFDDDFGDARLYRRGEERWTASTAAPKWPEELLASLDERGAGVHGANAVTCVDGSYFLELMELSAFPTPVIFPHGAWRLPGVGPTVQGNFRNLASAANGVDAIDALSALVNNGAGPEANGRLTGELPGRGRIQLGVDGGRAGVGSAYAAVTENKVTVTFAEGSLGLGFAPLDWERQFGAQVWDVDDDSAAAEAGVVPGMVFTHIRGKSVEGWTFSEIDGEFDGPRPLEVKFNTKVPGAERLYAVEMIAEEVTEALLRRKDPEMETFDFEEPGAVFEESTAAVIWREEPSTIFFGDAGSTTVVHHDIIGQVELCHVLSGSKLLAAAPWGKSSEKLLRKAGARGLLSDGKDDGELEEGGVLSAPVHRPLTPDEIALLKHDDLAVVLARPGDCVAFSSICAHFATNGANEPCAAVFHGILTPASTHVLASHPERLDPFSDEEIDEDGFDGHLTGRAVLEELIPAGKDVITDYSAVDKIDSAMAKESGEKGWRMNRKMRGKAGDAAVKQRFAEAVLKMDSARDVSKAPKTWTSASRTVFYVEPVIK